MNSDRYYYSGLAYSIAKGINLLKRGLDPHWCFEPEKGLLLPDIVFYLDLEPANANRG